MPRLFLAATPDDDLRAGLHALGRRLRRDLPDTPPLRWLDADGLHLTLRFYGDVGEDRVPSIAQLAAEVAIRHRPCATALHRIEYWPPGAPRVVVAAFADEPLLADLAADLEAGSRRLGFAPETRRYRPHVTLARAPGRRLATVPAELPALSLTVRAISLYESRREADRSHYRPLAHWPLAAAG